MQLLIVLKPTDKFMDTYNIAAYTPVNGTGTAYQLEWGVNPSPTVTFGSGKLVARLAQLLLTSKGSDRTDPSAGCHLLSLIAQTHISESDFIHNEVVLMLEDINYQMINENDVNTPAEAQVRLVECSDVKIKDDCVLVYFTIITLANTKLEFQLPVSTI